jgi:sugar transferase EpsL
MNISKRLLDVVVSGLGLIILAPVFIGTAILVRIKLGSPILFTQIRPGLHSQPFKMMKFRTMTDERDEQGESYCLMLSV